MRAVRTRGICPVGDWLRSSGSPSLSGSGNKAISKAKTNRQEQPCADSGKNHQGQPLPGQVKPFGHTHCQMQTPDHGQKRATNARPASGLHAPGARQGHDAGRHDKHRPPGIITKDLCEIVNTKLLSQKDKTQCSDRQSNRSDPGSKTKACACAWRTRITQSRDRA
jgi:hypothetical protein